MKKIKSRIFTCESGLTLIELLVVMGIFLVVGTISVNMLMSTMRASNKASVMNKLKQNGDNALSIYERIIRNTKQITNPACTSSGTNSSSMELKGVDEKTYILTMANGKITYAVDGDAEMNLIDTDEAVLAATGANFRCTKGANPPSVVKINFTLQNATAISTETTTIPFETSIILRNN